MFLLSIFKRILIVALICGTAFPSWAATYYVDSNFQGESPSGTSWISAFPSIQMAIDAASKDGGGQIWVKSGVYKPDGLDKTATFDLKPNITIYGGFRGSETKLDERIVKANRTVLSGDIGRVGSISDNCYHVLTASGNCRIDGFIISRGIANSTSEHRFGGGLLVRPGSKNVIASNCTFEKNTAESGGAIHLTEGELSITNCTFYSNSGETGGAISIEGQSLLTIQDSIFSSNFAPKSGGALSVKEGGNVNITDTSFLYNSTDGDGGALAAVSETHSGIQLKIFNSTFLENSARNNGGAASFSGPFYPTIKKCSFENNYSPRGAGAIANRSGTTTVILEITFAKNRGSKGSENIGNDSSSSVVESQAAADQLAKQTEAALNPPEPVAAAVVEQKKRQLPDAFVYNAKDNTKLKLRSVVANADTTVFIFGDLTDDAFIKGYRYIEAAARDFYPKGVRFFYIYRNLRHPENNGYIRPFNVKERARQVQLAQELLNTSVPWLYDPIDNPIVKALAPDETSGVLIFSRNGEEEYQGEISDNDSFRSKLTELAGTVFKPFKMNELPRPSIQPINLPEAILLPRAQVNVNTDKLKPLQITPVESRAPFYVKARIEGSENVLKSGDGKLYLGFHIDPLYHVEWNNLGEPLSYILKAPKGVIAPSINSAPRVTGVVTDSEPREFILQARKLDLKKPIAMEVTYSVHTSANRNLEVTQQYLIYLEHDMLGGEVIGRQLNISEKIPSADKNVASSNAYKAMLRRFDVDRNGELTEDEVIGRLNSRFDSIDLNHDGAISESEYADYRKKQ
ncbi:hypothetical protein P4C99_10110 [Pontiellaceae bacterium B1224]|nr:hypothetical protein [Pontiellaceae bacterium B1224]